MAFLGKRCQSDIYASPQSNEGRRADAPYPLVAKDPMVRHTGNEQRP